MISTLVNIFLLFKATYMHSPGDERTSTKLKPPAFGGLFLKLHTYETGGFITSVLADFITHK